jgi:serine/threonine-protein kinase
MQDLTGRTLGHYRIVEKIGEGGMGLVYRAHDERLDRDVAIKVLPAEVAQDAARLARFEREARLLASLSHQNIATLYGLEEFDGWRFLVMELVQGETLAEQLKNGAVPVDEALPIALQIAEGLEAAHERGIIHRDLKPANVMVSAEGQVKVLDFGLAKARQIDRSDVDLTHSPTLTGQATAAGVLLGTAAYMSPEQARGKTADKRADIWAFGVTLFEMLTGNRLFDGETTSDVLAAVLRSEPDWSDLPVGTPGAIGRLLRRCVERDPRGRLHDIADARLEIEEAISQPDLTSTQRLEGPKQKIWERVRAVWPMMLASVVVGALLAASARELFDARSTIHAQPVRLTLAFPKDVAMRASFYPRLTISPDGNWLVFAANESGIRRLFKRSLGQLEAAPIPGTEGAVHPFFSPDGNWVGFFADEKLKKVALTGGSPQTLADSLNPWGASWGPDGMIVSNLEWSKGLFSVPAGGGTPEQIAAPDFDQGDFDLLWPEVLPDGKAVLFTAWRGISAEAGRIEVLDLESRSRKILIENASYARYVPTGHLVFGQKGRIYVVRFDLGRREVVGRPVLLSESIFYEIQNGVPDLAFSTGGILVGVPSGGAPRRQLMSVDLTGRERPLSNTQRSFIYPRYSPSGDRLAVTIEEPEDRNIWVLNLVTGAQTRLTHEGENFFPCWTPDGEWVTYLSVRGPSAYSIDRKRADGMGKSEPLVNPGGQSVEALFPGAWSPSGEVFVFTRSVLTMQLGEHGDLWLLDSDGDREPRLFLGNDFDEYAPAISPDGRWLAYAAAVLEHDEIYVQPLPGGGERHQVSVHGGRGPVWSPDGRTIYYRPADGDQVFAVSVSTSPQFRTGPPRVLFEGPYERSSWESYRNFDIAPDGKSFVMIKGDEEWGGATEVRVVLNWFEELKRLVPTE